MTPALEQEAVLSVGPQKDSVEQSSSYSSIMNGFGLWSSAATKKASGSETGSASDEELGEELVVEERVVAAEFDDCSTASKKQKRRLMAGVFKKLKARAGRKKELRIQKLESNATPKSCIPTITLPARRFYPVQITVLEGADHNDYEIDDMDDEELAKETKTLAQAFRIKTLEWMTEQRVKDAIANDDNESICSLDGIPILPPPEGAQSKSKKQQQKAVAAKPRDLTKIKPEFVQATKGPSALERVRKEVEAIMMRSAAAEAVDAAASTSAPEKTTKLVTPTNPVPAPVVEQIVADPELLESAATPEPPAPESSKRSAGWSLFSSSKPKENSDEVQQNIEEKETEQPKRNARDAELYEDDSTKKNVGWSLFSWKSKNNREYEDDGDFDEVADDESEEYGSLASYDDEGTKASLASYEDDVSRNTRSTTKVIVNRSRK